MSNPEMNVDQRPQRRPENVNTSGKGHDAPVPNAVKDKFNWGAFFLTWIWGLFHRQYLTLISLVVGFIPFIGGFASLGLAIWFGIKGNEWAWQGRHYNSINQFHESQKKWATAGVIVFVIFFALGIAYAMLFGAALMSNPELINGLK